jgi:hypothetical protein
MCIEAFHKALYQTPVSQQERAALTPDELFMLLLAHKLDDLTAAEQQRLPPDDLDELAAAGLIGDVTGLVPGHSPGSHSLP